MVVALNTVLWAIRHISRSGNMSDLLVHLVGPGRYDEHSTRD
ncbi:hypothetical protein [Rathayibacter sp. VKM Ac-2760]|nr:hypothetical protein [Rathayibacter sp. VKM Ac-2760]